MDISTASPPIRDRRTLPVRALLALVAALGVSAVAAFPGRELLFVSIAGAAASSPVAGFVAESGLLALLAVVGVLVAWTWMRDRWAFGVLTSAGVGVVGAYLASEGIKLLVAEQRPCRVLDVPTVSACPAPGDWSWPSNHAVLAAAFATACVLAAPRTAWFVAPLALLVAVSRVAAGVHYVHDVASGLALGTLLVLAAVAGLRPVVDRLLPGRRDRARRDRAR